jgi:ribonuclease P protein component
VYERGARLRGRFMTCFALPNELGTPRLGIATSRKIGNAVVRNRAKRLVRGLFRSHKPLTGIDIVVIPRREMIDASWRNLEADYRAALQRLEKAAGALLKT